jgi:hypothetical protein
MYPTLQAITSVTAPDEIASVMAELRESPSIDKDEEIAGE